MIALLALLLISLGDFPDISIMDLRALDSTAAGAIARLDW